MCIFAWMKYAIIAAGDGSRLAQEGVTDSKPLVKVNGERLIDRLIRVFVANDATDILVICNEHMTDVARHLVEVEEQGLNGHHVPLQFLIKTTLSSMHSLYELRKYLLDEPFILTTVDTIFDEQAFSLYVSTFRERLHQGVDALMGVTNYIDDEKPLYVSTDSQLHVTGYYDHAQPDTQYISAGIYGLTPLTLSILNDCIAKGQHRMRNFQRALVVNGLHVEAYPLSKVFDIDHASDITKAEEYLNKRL